ncbi:MAG: amidohydrolase [Clostridia bacterium]|nr:amidohydrolase [Clostridia bacterium]
MKYLFKNAKILDLDKGCFIEGSVEVVDNLITQVGEVVEQSSYDRVIDCKGNILMPGFVDTHCHTPMSLLRSFKDDATFDEWFFDNIFPAEQNLTPEDIYFGQYLGITESVRAGITTLEEGYFHNDRIYEAVDKSGIRARIGIGPTMRDVGMSNVEYLEKEASVVPTTDRIKLNCFVHSIYTTNAQVIKESVEFTDIKNIPLSIHLAETKKEVEDSLNKYGKTPTEYLNDLDFFKKPCLCYHSVHMTDNDLHILKDNGASVSTCPSSNIKLASGIADIAKMLDFGINVTIGTDGVASNNSLDMFKEMFLVATLSKVLVGKSDVVSSLDVLKMATVNGAKALGYNAGEIKVGKNADIILIDINSPHYYPSDNLLSHLVYAGKSSDVYFTMVDGKVLYDSGNYYIGEDINNIYAKVNDIRNRLKKTISNK